MLPPHEAAGCCSARLVQQRRLHRQAMVGSARPHAAQPRPLPTGDEVEDGGCHDFRNKLGCRGRHVAAAAVATSAATRRPSSCPAILWLSRRCSRRPLQVELRAQSVGTRLVEAWGEWAAIERPAQRCFPTRDWLRLRCAPTFSPLLRTRCRPPGARTGLRGTTPMRTPRACGAQHRAGCRRSMSRLCH